MPGPEQHHPHIEHFLSEADRKRQKAPTGSTTTYPELGGADRSPAPDFPLLARLDHVRAFLLDHPELIPHVASVDATALGRQTASIYLRSDSGHAPLLQMGPPTRMIRSATATGGLQRTAYLDLDGVTIVAFETLSAEQLDAALVAGGVR